MGILEAFPIEVLRERGKGGEGAEGRKEGIRLQETRFLQSRRIFPAQQCVEVLGSKVPQCSCSRKKLEAQ